MIVSTLRAVLPHPGPQCVEGFPMELNNSKRLFRKRWVFGGVAIAILGTLAWCAYPAFQREAAVRALKRSGAEFWYELHPGFDYIPEGFQSVPNSTWLRRMSPTDVFNEPRIVQFSGDVDESSMALLAELPSVVEVNFYQCVIDEEILRGLSRYRGVVSTRLYRCRFTPSALPQWRKLQTLESVVIGPIPAGLSLADLLKDMYSLRNIRVFAADAISPAIDKSISVDEFQALVGSDAIRSIDISGYGVFGDYAVFQTFGGLESLSIHGAEMQRQELQKLVYVPRLKNLSLRTCTLTEEHVDVLLQMQKLQSLDISENSLSPDAISRLADGLKGCSIRYGTISEGYRYIPADQPPAG